MALQHLAIKASTTLHQLIVKLVPLNYCRYVVCSILGICTLYLVNCVLYFVHVFSYAVYCMLYIAYHIVFAIKASTVSTSVDCQNGARTPSYSSDSSLCLFITVGQC